MNSIGNDMVIVGRIHHAIVHRLDTATPESHHELLGMNAIAGLAVVLLILWVVLKVALAVTSGLLHLLWIAAVVMLVVWLVGKLRGSKSA